VTYISDVNEEDEVVLIGKCEDEKITADALASLAGTINYEIVARINPLIPRVIL
jgi:alanine racemase